ncbi:hypothetical protein C9374_005363 [Naegleria lovaniensis]|uniref:Selenoprotein O n=1 Tax=Naegleria lovaniensis TaxID=51637 RepID=A0AA88KN43_NAELO|nr:uncharacterized protein C9374_005363 [Naegleria lovaniensis]KAG2382161.1 hypothetical protein C9374_005363 [Naegleria lovaniensis]
MKKVLNTASSSSTPSSIMITKLFDQFNFVNTFTKQVIGEHEAPITSSSTNKTTHLVGTTQSRQVPHAMYSFVHPTPLELPEYEYDHSTGKLTLDRFNRPKHSTTNITSKSSSQEEDDDEWSGFTKFEFVIASNEVARDCFGVDLLEQQNRSNKSFMTLQDLEQICAQEENRKFPQRLANILSGYELLSNTQYYAHCYGGFQFGHYAGQLGDGRAISMGQIDASSSSNGNTGSSSPRLVELQFKGAGPTPFSRNADGRAVLRSSIREFLASEFMNKIGVATTRAFSLVRSKDRAVLRDEFYNGNPKYEYGAIVMRVAPTFVRFGSFEVFLYRFGQQEREFYEKEVKNIDILAKYVIKNHYSHLLTPDCIDTSTGEVTLNNTVREAFAKEVVRRTAKLTADWMSSGFVHGVLNTDNMSILGVTIDYGPFGFMDYYNEDFVPNNSDDEGRYRYKNQPAICYWNLQKLMRALIPTFLPDSTDYFTKVLSIYAPHFEHYYLLNFRKKLGLIPYNVPEVDTKVDVTDFNMFQGDSDSLREKDWELIEGLLVWMHTYKADFTNFFRALSDLDKNNNEPSETLIETLMATLEPRVNSSASSCSRTGQVSNTNVLDTNDLELATQSLKQILTQYTQRLSHESMSHLSNEDRKSLMDKMNPRYILRNYLVQQVIEAAERFDYEPLYEYYDILLNPYVQHQDPEIDQKYAANAPVSARCLKLSCSS